MRLLIICLLLLFSTITVAHAQSDEVKALAKQKAQKAIDACWAISLADRSSINTNRQRYGTLDSALCMEKHINMLAEEFIFPNSPDLVQQMKDNIEKLRFSYSRIYWDLYNAADGCFADRMTGCGTMFHGTHNWYYAKLLEEIILTSYERILEFEEWGASPVKRSSKAKH